MTSWGEKGLVLITSFMALHWLLPTPDRAGSLPAKMESLSEPMMRTLWPQHSTQGPLSWARNGILTFLPSLPCESQLLCLPHVVPCLLCPFPFKSSFKDSSNTTSSRDFLGPPKLKSDPFPLPSGHVFQCLPPISYLGTSFPFQVRSSSEAGTISRASP